MKAVIPVAGAGTRLRPHTFTQPKPLIPVAGKPIISVIVENLAKTGITEFIFVLGYLGEKIELFLNQQFPDLDKTFVYQENRLGLGHALWVSRKHFEDADELFISLGDTIVDMDYQSMVDAPISCLAIRKVSDPRNFGVVQMDKENIVCKIVEKPQIPKSNLAVVGLYKIKEVQQLSDALDELIRKDIKTHNEFQLTDALSILISEGAIIKGVPVSKWFDCGRKDILLETNAMLLSQEGYADEQIHAYDNSIIIPPVSIGKNCQISNSIIGPYVSIGEHTTIQHAVIKDSIIGGYTTIKETVLHKSIIGNDATVRSRTLSLNIGENTEIDFE